LKTPLRRSRPELDRHAWLESADAYAYDRGSMEESIAGPVRELDEAVPLSRIEPFQFTPNRRRGRLTELCFGKLRRDLGMAQRVAVVLLLLRHDFGMARSAITVCFSDDLPSTLTNQSASLYDEIPYGFEHARPPENRLSLLGVGRSITAQGREAAGSVCEQSTLKLILGGRAEVVSGKYRIPFAS
jgi:hypothetical protein